jgi:hypothetical protein
VSLLVPTSVERLGALLTAASLICMRLTRRTLAAVRERQADHQEQPRLAQLRLDRVAERDHEPRIGLAGLAGATEALPGVGGGGTRCARRWSSSWPNGARCSARPGSPDRPVATCRTVAVVRQSPQW